MQQSKMIDELYDRIGWSTERVDKMHSAIDSLLEAIGVEDEDVLIAARIPILETLAEIVIEPGPGAKVSRPTLDVALDWVAHGLRKSLVQQGCGKLGVEEVDVLAPGWPAIYRNAVMELWGVTGGPKVGQYVLAKRTGDRAYRRFRIVTLDEDGDGWGVGSEAWSAANSKASWDIHLREAIYIG